ADAGGATVAALGGHDGAPVTAALGVPIAADGVAFARHTRAAVAAAEQSLGASGAAADAGALGVGAADARRTFLGRRAGGTWAQAAGGRDGIAFALRLGAQGRPWTVEAGLALAERAALARRDVGSVVAADV